MRTRSKEHRNAIAKATCHEFGYTDVTINAQNMACAACPDGKPHVSERMLSVNILCAHADGRIKACSPLNCPLMIFSVHHIRNNVAIAAI